MPKKKMPKVEVGDAATICFVNDCYPATVIEVRGHKVTVQHDIYKYVKGNVFEGTDEYEYTRDENGRTETFSLRKNNTFALVGHDMKYGPLLHLGRRRFYQNPSI